MKNTTFIALLALTTSTSFLSCKRTYQCTCPVFTPGGTPYIFEVEASTAKTAKRKCIEAGEKDPVVSGQNPDQCHVYSPPDK